MGPLPVNRDITKKKEEIDNSEIANLNRNIIHFPRKLTFLPPHLSHLSFPETAFGLLIERGGTDDKVLGSGCLISSNIFLTCASNCSSRRDHTGHQNLYVCFARHHQQVAVKQMKYQPRLLYDNIPALLFLDSPYIQDQVGSLGFILDHDLSQDIIQQTKLFLTGFSSKNEGPPQFFLKQLNNLEDFCLAAVSENVLSGAVLAGRFSGELFFLGLYEETSKGPLLCRFDFESIKQISDVDQSQRRMWHLGNDGIEYFSTKPGEVQLLNMGRNCIDDTVLSALCSTPRQKLAELNMTFNEIVNQSPRHLGLWELPHLQSLELRGNHISGEGFRQLTKGDWAHLTLLDISSNEITGEGLAHIKESNWHNLQILKADSNQISRQGIVGLTQHPMILLSTLNLTYNLPLVNTDLETLPQAHWRYLTNLEVSANGAEDLEAISSCQWPHLKEMTLSNSDLNGSCLRFLSQKVWSHLTSLTLGSCKYLSRIRCENLQILSLCDNSITNKGVHHLSKAILPELLSLVLVKNDITSEGLAHFSRGNWTRLQIICFYSNKLEKQGIRELLKSPFPLRTIELKRMMKEETKLEIVARFNIDIDKLI